MCGVQAIKTVVGVAENSRVFHFEFQTCGYISPHLISTCTETTYKASSTAGTDH